jgi:hypothetical protein
MITNLLSILLQTGIILLALFSVVLLLYLLLPFSRVSRITPFGGRETVGFLWKKKGTYILYDSILPFFPSTRIGSVRGSDVHPCVVNNQHNLVEQKLGTVDSDGYIYDLNNNCLGACGDKKKRRFDILDINGATVGRVNGSLRSNFDLNARAAAFALLSATESEEETSVFDVRVGLRDLLLPAALIYAVLFPLTSWIASMISGDINGTYFLIALLVYPVILLILYIAKYEATLQGNPFTFLIQMIDRNLGLGWMNTLIIILSAIALVFVSGVLSPLFVVLLIGFLFNLSCFPGSWHQNEPSDTWTRKLPKAPKEAPAAPNTHLVTRQYPWKPVMDLKGIDCNEVLELTFNPEDYDGLDKFVRTSNPFQTEPTSLEETTQKATAVLAGIKTADNSEETALTKILNSAYQLCMQFGLADFELFDLVLGFIQTNILYKLDEECDSIGKKKEYFRFPGETLFDVEGDCDCKAVLAYGLFKRLGVDVDLVVVKANDSDEYNHAAVVFKNKPEAPVKLPPGFKEYAPGKGYYCELTGEGFHPGDIPQGVDPNSIIPVPRP